MSRSGAEAAVTCMLLRGGTSKGAYFLPEDLPAGRADRDDLLLRLMGAPDPREIDGVGGGHPLTSKAAVVGSSRAADADVDYLFLQVGPDRPVVGARQTCGNLLSGVGAFAIERGLVPADGDVTTVVIRLLNGAGGLVTAHVPTPGGVVDYTGDQYISGVPSPAAAVRLDFPARAAPISPTGNVRDRLDGVWATCVDAGMPVVLVRAADVGARGDEEPAELESDAALCARVERIRVRAGKAMGLGDVTGETVPKVALVSAPVGGGDLATRSFIPARVHQAIGVVAAISTAAGALLPGSVAEGLLRGSGGERPGPRRVALEHPSGLFEVEVELAAGPDGARLARGSVIRTARKIFDGLVWPRAAGRTEEGRRS